MKAEAVDERTGNWEVDFPAYRVYFFSADGATDTNRVVEARDVHQVFDWADAQARGRRYILYVEVEDAREIGLLQLAGGDPNDLTIRAGYHRPISADCDSRTPGAQGTRPRVSARVEASSRLWKPSTSHCATRESTCGAQSRRSGSANPSIGSRTSPFLTQRSGSSHRVRRCSASCASCLMAGRLWPSSPPSALASLAHARALNVALAKDS